MTTVSRKWNSEWKTRDQRQSLGSTFWVKVASCRPEVLPTIVSSCGPHQSTRERRRLSVDRRPWEALVRPENCRRHPWEKRRSALCHVLLGDHARAKPWPLSFPQPRALPVGNAKAPRPHPIRKNGRFWQRFFVELFLLFFLLCVFFLFFVSGGRERGKPFRTLNPEHLQT